MSEPSGTSHLATDHTSQCNQHQQTGDAGGCNCDCHYAPTGLTPRQRQLADYVLTQMEITENSIIVLKGPGSYEAVKMLKGLLRKSNKTEPALIIGMHDSMDISDIDEEAMRKHGWQRIIEERSK